MYTVIVTFKGADEHEYAIVLDFKSKKVAQDVKAQAIRSGHVAKIQLIKEID